MVSAEEYEWLEATVQDLPVNALQWSYPSLILDGGRKQRDGVLFRNAPLDSFLTQSFEPHLSVKRCQVKQPCKQEKRIHSIWIYLQLLLFKKFYDAIDNFVNFTRIYVYLLIGKINV